MEHDQNVKAPEFHDYVAVIRGRIKLIAACLVVALLLGGLYVVTRTPAYTSTASVLVENVSSNPAVPPDEPDIETEAEVALSTDVLGIVAESIDGVDREALADSVSVSIPGEGTVLVFTVTSTDAALVQRAAQAYADGYIEYRNRRLKEAVGARVESLQDQIEADEEAYAAAFETLKNSEENSPAWIAASNDLALINQRLTDNNQLKADLEALTDPSRIIQAATESSFASTSKWMILIAAGMLGLIIGVVLAFLLEGLSGRVRETEDIERDLGSSVLGLVPLVKGDERVLATRDAPGSPASEAFRVIRSVLLYRADGDLPKVVMVTSGAIGEGKSATAANLATALAQSEHRTILVSADCRRPSLQRYFGLPADEGLSAVLPRSSTIPVLTSDVKHLSIVPSGPPVEASAHLFESPAFGVAIDALRGRADFIVIDAPPLMIADPLLMAPHVDWVVVVVDERRATKAQLKQTRELLERVGAPTVGIVINRADQLAGPYAYRYGTSYRYEPDSVRAPVARPKPRRSSAG